MTDHKNKLVNEILAALNAYAARHPDLDVGIFISALLCSAASVIADNFADSERRGAIWADLLNGVPALAEEVEQRIAIREFETVGGMQ